MSHSRAVLSAALAVLALAGGGAVLAEIGGATQTPALATTQWASTGQLSGGVVALLRDARWVHGAIVGGAAPSVRTYCLYLYTDAQGENTDLLPSPDHQLTELLSSAYDGFIQAAATCDTHAASALALERVDHEVHASVSTLTEAVLREEAVTGRSLRVHGIP